MNEQLENHKLEKRLCRQVGQAIIDYNKIEEGDKIILDVARFAHIWKADAMDFPPPNLWRWTINTTTGKVTDASHEEPKIRKIEGPAAEPLNLQSVAGGAMMKRLLPIAGAILGVLLFIVRPFRRRRRNRES